MWAKSEIRESGGKGFGLYLQQDIKVMTKKGLERNCIQAFSDRVGRAERLMRKSRMEEWGFATS